ncbi:MAG: hypothetical protein RSC68_30645 [Acinetobacter sp.]
MNKSNVVRGSLRVLVAGVSAGAVAFAPKWMEDTIYDAVAKGAAVAASVAGVDLIWAGTETVLASSVTVNGETVKDAAANVVADGVDISIDTHSADDAPKVPPTSQHVKTNVTGNQQKQQGTKV